MSLKSRYTRLASVISFLLVSAALFATWYAQHVSSQNTYTLKLKDEVTASTTGIRNDIWASDIALNSLLIRPSDEYNADIDTNLTAAGKLTDKLIANRDLKDANLLPKIMRLKNRLDDYTTTVRELIKKRQDPNWVYPVLPYINSKLLVPNIEFETAVDQALQEIATTDGRSYASPMYGEFAQLRDLWRRKILNFRAVVIRFAGLNEPKTSAQEANIKSLHEEIEKRLNKLQKLSDKGKLGIQSEVSLEEMRKASKEWQARWNIVKQYRSSEVWRADVHFMQTQVRPVQQELLSSLVGLDQAFRIGQKVMSMPCKRLPGKSALRCGHFLPWLSCLSYLYIGL